MPQPVSWFSYLVKRLKAEPEKFHMVFPEPEMVNVCFWYVPARLRGVPHGPERMQELGRVSIFSFFPSPSVSPFRSPVTFTHVKVTAQLKSRMMNAGTLMISYQPLGDIPNFFRNIVSNPGVQHKDIDFLVAELDRLGHDL